MSKNKRKIEQSSSSINLKVSSHLDQPNENDLKNKYLKTNQQFNTLQKLFEFISDKGKITLNSYFDQKGSIEFLNGKSEAMKKIELNEFILDENIEKNKNDKKEKKNKNKKNHKIHDSHNNKFDEIKNIISNDCESINNRDIKNIRTQKNFKNIIKEKKTNTTKNRTEKEEESKINNNTNDNVNSKFKKINLKVKNNNDKNSIDSQITVNSKLFNTYKDYQKSKKLISRDDVPLFEEILAQLKTNQK